MTDRLALLSVSDKAGLVEFARELNSLGWKLLSTGGTARTLRDAGLKVTDVSDYTGFPEMMDGRVKTLHPKIHGGLLGRRSVPAHTDAMKANGVTPIDLVCVNLYPFEQTVARLGATLDEAIENIDIGGPSMLRSAAKNSEDVTVICDPIDYDIVCRELKSNGNRTSRETRFRLAVKAYQHTAAYDAAISNWLAQKIDGESTRFPSQLTVPLVRVRELRYGENPHQKAALYREKSPGPYSLAAGEVLQGKELSYNNWLDLHAALELVREFIPPAVSIIKHNNPCGCATASELSEAYRKAHEADPVSAFGGIVGLNREVDGPAARRMSEIFLECVVAPNFSAEALEILSAKKNLRLVRVPFPPVPDGAASTAGIGSYEFRRISGGMLVQDWDTADAPEADWKVVTRRPPSEAERRALAFAWKVSRHVKSNAIVLARDGQLVGTGAGQMNRVDSARLAVERSVLGTKDVVCASDAFFPFPDGLETVARAGATAAIQPGGSVRDDEVIRAADAAGMAMVFTGFRHFRH
ncbi:MAG: bifunctional phosphoribosylaminoimidazolecarboxamide formyltransferase/IMP cyclohydrolase [Deltaproteobacteria bacterium]|nr:bifunctional phosphoribosylaminoimidazolecarboxamide formyltransferase/IMP cyclohydrolase [Deltaproteobacteria bacterium]